MKEEVLEFIRKTFFNVFQNKNSKVKLILFGSRASGKFRVYSDYDLCLYSDKKIPANLKAIFDDELNLNSPTLCTFDILEYSYLSPTFRKAVEQDGILLFES